MIAKKNLVKLNNVKLNDIKKKLSKLNKRQSKNTRSKKTDPSDFISTLFRRASSKFIKTCEIEKLTKLAHDSYVLYLDFISSEKDFIVETTTEKNGNTILKTIIFDRPFVVDSLAMLFEKLGIEEKFKLHPIIPSSDAEKNISLVYVETNLKNKKVNLKKEVSNLLKTLLTVTEEFPEILIQAENASSHILNNKYKKVDKLEQSEAGEFIKWLINPGFVFLGSCEYTLRGGSKNTKGIFKVKDYSKSINKEIKEDIKLFSENHVLSHSKLSLKSPIHRDSYVDCFCVKIDKNKFQIFLGLITYRGFVEDSSKVPLVRYRINKIAELEKLPPKTHNYKELISFADDIPKFDFIELSLTQLREEFSIIYELKKSGLQKLNIYKDRLNRFTCFRLILPKDRISGENNALIKEEIEKFLKVEKNSCEIYTFKGDSELGSVSFLVPKIFSAKDSKKLEQKIYNLSKSWEELLLDELNKSFEEDKAEEIFHTFSNAFPEDYKSVRSSKEAVYDIKNILKIDKDSLFEISSISRVVSGFKKTHLIIYKRGETISLSEIIPFLDNIGFSIERETVTTVTSKDLYTIYAFTVVAKLSNNEIDSNLPEKISNNLKLALSNKAYNDSLNSLIISAELSCENIAVLRTALQYLWQIKAIGSKLTLVNALNQNPAAAKVAIDYFLEKFDPSAYKGANNKNRDKNLKKIKNKYLTLLKTVTNLAYDRALRSLINFFEAAVRTNFFQGHDEYRIAFKIKCSEITEMPSPRPLFETFVCADEFEGVHLRGGYVARGGLRWSDRVADFRTEVLGLMKTQVTKNSIIVPTGAKGGFVVKNRPTSRDALRAKVEQCYRKFITSLLELSDNLVNGKIVRPKNTVIHDIDDPYLVVAADRGTATFSDIANSIAIHDFNFWLGDAFASGGSNGYDHKKYGITAKGAWVTTCRHFREIGLDIDKEEFTVTGIGDMAGDVFGNGMLLSDNIKLIAAFNHVNIFIDPNPNSKKSFKERKRLFNLKHSSWKDYSKKIISKGGGVYQRAAKEIKINADAAKSLNCEPGVYNGEDLIKIILKAPADLLWNGGIGTYIKASFENEVGDPSNDSVRINSKETHARVIGEGGNLGLTQKARIEYSRIGGKVNTDAVDNSGGVDLSDHEVNLKILFQSLVKNKKLSLDKRNKLLEKCALEVCDKVLNHNRLQSQLISLAVRRSRKHLRYYRSLLNMLENEGLLNRNENDLPDDEALASRGDKKAGLTRPELCVLVAHTKIAVYNSIISTKISEDKSTEKYLINYFPKEIAKNFKKDVLRHPLRKEIISTIIANLFVERMGSSFIVRTCEELSVSKETVIRAFLTVEEILQVTELEQELSKIDNAGSTKEHLDLLNQIQEATELSIRWIITNNPRNFDIAKLATSYKKDLLKLFQQSNNLIPELEAGKVEKEYKKLVKAGVNKKTASIVTNIKNSADYLDIIDISKKQKLDSTNIAKLYMMLSSALQIRKISQEAKNLDATDRWEIGAKSTCIAEMKKAIAKITFEVSKVKAKSNKAKIETYFSKHKEGYTGYKESLYELQKNKITLPAIFVLNKQLENLGK